MLEFAHGSVQWLASDGVGVNYSISGLPFQPKALRFYWMGLGSIESSLSDTTHQRAGIGFAVSASSRRCVSVLDSDAAATMTCGSVCRDDAIASTMTSADPPVQDGALDLTAIASDGFTLTVDDDAPTDIMIFWEAWGGSDITVAQLVDIDEPAATGNVDYSVIGFTAGATDQVVMFAGCQSAAALNTVANTDAGLMAGFASSGTAADNCVVSTQQADAGASSATGCFSKNDECLAMGTVGTATSVNARAALTQFGADNFRLNWITRGLTGRKYIALAIKGGQWKAGGLTINGSVVGNTFTVSGLTFKPIGVCMLDSGNAVNTTAGSALGRLTLGSGETPTYRRAMGLQSRDAQADAQVSLSIAYDAILTKPADTPAVANSFDLDAMLSDGFRIITDVNSSGTGASDWKGYLTFGGPAGPTITAQPEAASALSGGTAQFSVTASGSPNYQWQKDVGTGFANVSGATSDTYTTPALDGSENGTKYRCRVTDGVGLSLSDEATLRVDAGGSVITSGKAQFDSSMVIEGWW